MRKLVISAVALVLLFLGACQPKPQGEVVTVPGGSYRNVSPADLHTMLKSKDFVFVNVHIPFAGNIAGTDLSIPYDEITQRASELPKDKNARIVLYCRSGHMSDIAARSLVQLGYTNLWNLKGGMVAWEAAGFPLQRP